MPAPAAAAPLLQECVGVLQAAQALEQGQGGAQELAAATGRAVAALKARPGGLSAPEAKELSALAGQLWNVTIDLPLDQARSAAVVRQCASDLLAALPAEHLLAQGAQAAAIFRQTGKSLAELGEYEAADAAYARGLEIVQWLQDTCFASRAWGALEQDCGATLLGLLAGRLDVAQQLGQQMLVSALVAQACEFACDGRVPSCEGNGYRLELVHVLKTQATALLQQSGREGQAAPLLNTAYELLEKLDGEVLPEALQPEVQALVCQVLILLAWSCSASGDTDQALRVLGALRDMDPQHSVGTTVPALSHHILLQMGRFGEAETELWNLVSHEDAQPEVCLEAILSALAAPGGEGLASVRATLPNVLERFAEDASTLIAGLVGALASKSGGGGDGEAAAGAATAPGSEELEGLVLELVGDDRLLESLREEPGATASLHAQLWNHAVSLMEGQAFERALRVLSAVAALAAGSEAQAAALRAQALCCNSMGSFDRALEYVAGAEAAEPRSLATGFLRLKVCLAAHGGAGASDAVAALADCEGFTPDVLRLACMEARDAGEPAAAKKALQSLLAALAEGGQQECAPGYEATIFQNLIKLTLDSPPAQAEEAAGTSSDMDAEAAGESSSPGGSASPSERAAAARSSELGKYLDQAVQRMLAVGPQAFFATEDGKPLQLEWMALTAWSAACEASAAGQLQQTAVLMGASGDLWAAHPQPSAATLARQKMAFLCAAAAASDASDVADSQPGQEGALALTAQYLTAARTAAAAAAAVLPLGAAAGDSGKADAYLLLLEFHVATRQRDTKGQLDAIERAKALPAFSAEHFAKMAAAVKEGPHKSLDVCRAAELAALQRLTSEPALNYPVVAALLRSLVELSSADDEKLRLLEEAAGILKAAPRGAYAQREAAWLVVAAWNRGTLHGRYGRPSQAGQYMRLALDLLRLGHCPAELAERHQAMMEAELASTLAEAALTPGEPAPRSGRAAASAGAQDMAS